MKLITKITIVIFSINYFFSIAYSNSISNCSTCGGIGKGLGTIYPKDPIFYRVNFEMKCARRPGTFTTSTYTVNYSQGFFNSNYIWGWNNKDHFVFGYFNENKSFQIEAIERWSGNNRTYTYDFFDNSKKSLKEIFEKEIEGKKTNRSGSTQKCIFRS